MKTSELTREGMILLTEEHIHFGGMNLTYKLLVQTGKVLHRYVVSIRKGDEQDCADVGTDLEKALACYRSLVRGIVTPCTLSEVVEDLLTA